MGRGGTLSPELAIRKPLTAARLRELVDRGLSQTEIATETGYSRQRVNSACRQFGIEPTKKPWSPPAEHQQRATAARLAKGAEHIEAIRQCAADGMTATEAATKLGVTRDAIYNATRRHKIKFTSQAPRGVRRKPKQPKPPKAAKPPLPGTRRLSLPPCAICGNKMNERTAAAQVKLHPGITVYPRCRACDQRIAQSVQGIRSARAARQDGEGET